MYAKCAWCGKQAHVQPVVTADAWPAGWQIILNREGEHLFCSHTCAGAWHMTQAKHDAPATYEDLPAPAPTLFSTGLLPDRRGRVC